MRQGKLSELIHNSKEGGSCDFCSVEIFFEDVIEDGAGKEIVI